MDEPREQRTEPDEAERIPWPQRLYDSPFLLLLMGVVVTAFFYTLWGLLEILRMPAAPLP
jgi:hypothetical protein